ncbi:MAG: SpoIIE family protein phosphatase [Chloroflexi bacterium]|nr:SpoIIE family protein phosphatase [Chloroflexota bacterium]
MGGEVAVEKRISDLEAVLEISKVMAVEKNLDALLDLIIEKTVKVMDAERTSLYLVDHEKNELWTRTAEGLDDSVIRVPIGSGIAGRVAATKQLLNIADPYSDPAFDRSWDEKTRFQTRSILCAPLITHEDKVVGVVQVLNKKGRQFIEYDESLLLALASHAAIALDQAELVQHYVEKKQMAAALRFARDIQANVLPAECPSVEGFDIHGHCWPCDETGGDYYDFIKLQDERLGITVGDVTGHGVGPALLMMEGRSLLRALVSLQSDVRETVAGVNELLAEDIQEGMFITLFYAVLDPQARTLSYISAGHEPVFLYRGQTGEVEQIESKVMPVGILAGINFPEPESVLLDRGDVLLLYTDGAIDGRNGQDEMFNRQRLQEALVANAQQSAKEIVTCVYDTIREFCEDEALDDDLTLVVVKAI